MIPVVPIARHADFLRRLTPFLPAGVDPSETTEAAETRQCITFRFDYLDVLFAGRVEHRGTAAFLHLTGALGPLPFTAQAARRRRRALDTLTAAAGNTSLNWRVSPTQEITLEGTTELPPPLSPVVMVTGAVRLLLDGERYFRLLLDVLGEADYLNSSQAA